MIDAPSGEQIVATAREWVGTPVVWEASLKGHGCDCRGLVSGVARELGRPEARMIEATVVGYAGRVDEAALLAGLDRVFVRLADPTLMQPGDVLAFRYPSRSGRRRQSVQHLALFSGDRGRGPEMIHAFMGDPARVCEVPIGQFWGRRLAGAWRWKEI